MGGGGAKFFLQFWVCPSVLYEVFDILGPGLVSHSSNTALDWCLYNSWIGHASVGLFGWVYDLRTVQEKQKLKRGWLRLNKTRNFTLLRKSNSPLLSFVSVQFKHCMSTTNVIKIQIQWHYIKTIKRYSFDTEIFVQIGSRINAVRAPKIPATGGSYEKVKNEPTKSVRRSPVVNKMSVKHSKIARAEEKMSASVKRSNLSNTKQNHTLNAKPDEWFNLNGENLIKKQVESRISLWQVGFIYFKCVWCVVHILTDRITNDETDLSFNGLERRDIESKCPRRHREDKTNEQIHVSRH